MPGRYDWPNRQIALFWILPRVPIRLATSHIVQIFFNNYKFTKNRYYRCEIIPKVPSIKTDQLTDIMHYLNTHRFSYHKDQHNQNIWRVHEGVKSEEKRDKLMAGSVRLHEISYSILYSLYYLIYSVYIIIISYMYMVKVQISLLPLSLRCHYKNGSHEV